MLRSCRGPNADSRPGWRQLPRPSTLRLPPAHVPSPQPCPVTPRRSIASPFLRAAAAAFQLSLGPAGFGGADTATRDSLRTSQPPALFTAGSRTGHRHLLMATSPKANSCNHLLTKWAFLLNSSIFDSVFLSSIYKIIAIFI